MSTTPMQEAKAYLEKHRISHVMQQLATVVLHQKPADPRALMIKKLEEMKQTRSRGQSLVLFSRDNLVATFKIFDVTGKGVITLDQYHAAMADIGCKNYAEFPAGHETNRIQMDTFIDNALQGLMKH